MKKGIEDKGVTWGFLAFLGVFAAGAALLPEKAFSSSENRYLQKKPEFSVSSYLDGSFGKKYEEYLSDQFPGRDGWIGVKTAAELLRGQKDVNSIYIGRDGYLMERFDTEEIEGELLEKNLDKLGEFALGAAGELGADHVRVMLVPSASQIMTEKLPLWAAPYDQSQVVEQLADRLLAEGGDGAADMLVPVEETLMEERESRGPLYYRTDHHWTAAGGFVGYQAWAESMGIEPWPAEAFTVQTVSQDFYGTVYSKMNIPWRADTIELYMPVEEQSYKVYYDGGEEYRETLYEEKALLGKDQYTVYLDGNHGLTKIVNEKAAKQGNSRKLLIVKDSFAHCFAPFAVNHFETTVMADLRYLNVNLREWMKTEGVTDVLVLYQIPGFAKEKSVAKLR